MRLRYWRLRLRIASWGGRGRVDWRRDLAARIHPAMERAYTDRTALDKASE